MLSETDPQLADVLRKQFPVWGAQGIRVRHSSRLSPPLLFIEGSVSTPKESKSRCLDFHWKNWGCHAITTDFLPHLIPFCTVDLYLFLLWMLFLYCIPESSVRARTPKDQFSFPPLENKTFLSSYLKMSVCYSVVLIAPPAPPSSFHLHEIFTVWSHFMYWNITCI